MRKAVTITGITIAALFLCSFGDAFVVANYHRYQASKILTVLHTLHPGITTQAQAQEALRPFSPYRQTYESQLPEETANTATYTFDNSPSTTIASLEMMRSIPFRILYRWALFSVELRFKSGYLAEIKIVEMQQDHPGYPHPNGVSVRMTSSKLTGSSFPDANGYYEHSSNTFSVDEKGNPTGFTCCYKRTIEMDERATVDQTAHALNFQLQCMTSFIGCKNDRQILP